MQFAQHSDNDPLGTHPDDSWEILLSFMNDNYPWQAVQVDPGVRKMIMGEVEQLRHEPDSLLRAVHLIRTIFAILNGADREAHWRDADRHSRSRDDPLGQDPAARLLSYASRHPQPTAPSPSTVQGPLLSNHLPARGDSRSVDPKLPSTDRSGLAWFSAASPRPCPRPCARVCRLFRIVPMGRFPTPWSKEVAVGSAWMHGRVGGLGARRYTPGAGEPVIEPGGGVDVTDEAP